eukprot:CAMPEP_0179211556 /NCGR_PEP_ID=MMETSP0797-20121207/538_1 /TAXON_ID=47934 /ORGANISM="Dinophysis acuminata, Strain DAEP01" /LENGTH=48 /DNA_ID= /DNA_START= /DNA_END= /DNA_ORIENTATION=
MISFHIHRVNFGVASTRTTREGNLTCVIRVLREGTVNFCLAPIKHSAI